MNRTAPSFSDIVVFSIDNGRYALALDAVIRVVRMVEITALPESPQIVGGVINFQGQIIPVINLRRRFHLVERPTQLTDQLIIARTSRRTVALAVDAVTSIVNSQTRPTTDAAAISARLQYLRGVVTLDDGMILVNDLDTLLSLDEELVLDQAMLNYAEGPL
jgi:purine-binding chemotaxis protein CheW